VLRITSSHFISFPSVLFSAQRLPCGQLIRDQPFTAYRPFAKKRTMNNISILQEKQEGGSILHMTKALSRRISLPTMVIIEDEVVIFLHIIQDH
jgi:hypothetical protein